ncbi:hypothetical protein BS47DRAFT_1400439 [Hydnum rufescens UP504]|uniref:Uncharacterized protein n=1 Tax=Hydnum rufescens UP504 TaxID=1448309 RepID=A0A9P6DP72_9AGAM|nr:hypothetical protein BS47DRAFT_1400439 [Hydnum rufescens UP504]
MEDISTVGDNAQEETAYTPDQDQCRSDSCDVQAEVINLSSEKLKLPASSPYEEVNDDVDAAAIKGNIIPKPLGLHWSGRWFVPYSGPLRSTPVHSGPLQSTPVHSGPLRITPVLVHPPPVQFSA